ncbi:MAG: fibronectin type III domain-containing protein [Eubacterium sp.]
MKKIISILLSVMMLISALGGFELSASAADYSVPSYTASLLSGIKNLFPKIKHSYVMVEYKQPTCTSKGYSVYRCRYCGLKYKNTIPATAHSIVKDKAIAPSCTEAGYTAGEHCSKCGKIITAQKEIPALGHSIVKDNAVAPSCTEIGYTEGSHCSVCGEIITAQQKIPAAGHNFVDTVTKEATTTEEGVLSHICSVCGFTKTEVIPKKESTTSSSTSSSKIPAKASITSLKAAPQRAAVVKWSSVPLANKYQIQYSTSQSFPANYTKTVTVNQSTVYGGITLSKTVTGLNTARKYYFRIRSGNNFGYSAWSSVKTVTAI